MEPILFQMESVHYSKRNRSYSKWSQCAVAAASKKWISPHFKAISHSFYMGASGGLMPVAYISIFHDSLSPGWKCTWGTTPLTFFCVTGFEAKTKF